jgi:hypothetical protein
MVHRSISLLGSQRSFGLAIVIKGAVVAGRKARAAPPKDAFLLGRAADQSFAAVRAFML